MIFGVGKCQAALDREILEVFRAWAGHLAAASRIFLAAPGANGAVLFSGKDAPLQRSDPRICGVPFTTRRPTFAEAKRVLQMLLTVSEPTGAPAPSPPPKKVSGAAERPSIIYFKHLAIGLEAKDMGLPSLLRDCIMGATVAVTRSRNYKHNR